MKKRNAFHPTIPPTFMFPPGNLASPFKDSYINKSANFFHNCGINYHNISNPYDGKVRDYNRSVDMMYNRNKFEYSKYLKGYETQESDFLSTTVENSGKKLKKFMHTPITRTEQVYTKWEVCRMIKKAILFSLLGCSALLTLVYFLFLK